MNVYICASYRILSCYPSILTNNIWGMDFYNRLSTSSWIFQRYLLLLWFSSEKFHLSNLRNFAWSLQFHGYSKNILSASLWNLQRYTLLSRFSLDNFIHVTWRIRSCFLWFLILRETHHEPPRTHFCVSSSCYDICMSSNSVLICFRSEFFNGYLVLC